MVGGRWVRHLSVAYLRGKGFGFGVNGIFPQKAVAVGAFMVNVDSLVNPTVHICDTDLSTLAPTAFDYAFIGPRLTQLGEPIPFLREVTSKLRPSAHLLLIVPDSEISKERLQEWVAKAGGWRQKATYLRDGYHLHIYKVHRSTKGILPPAKPDPRPRACVARYGALGDAVLLTPLLQALHKDGYHVTLNASPYALPVLENCPWVDNVIVQEREAIPNPELGEYWKEWATHYDRYINLSESIEGGLLKVEWRPEFYTSSSDRRKALSNINYQDHTMALGGYPSLTAQRPTLFLTPKERAWAKRWREQFSSKKVVLWALNGSSYHKFYGLLPPLLDEWLEERPDCVVVLMGDSRSESGVISHPQVINGVGKYSIRELIALTEVVDCVVGPETALTNFASAFPTPKIVFLSHSTPTNLTAYWENTVALTPDPAFAPCYPCHQLHYSRESCPIVGIDADDDTVLAEGPVCAVGAISVERVKDALNTLIP